jgi:hypothetical protein
MVFKSHLNNYDIEKMLVTVDKIAKEKKIPSWVKSFRNELEMKLASEVQRVFPLTSLFTSDSFRKWWSTLPRIVSDLVSEGHTRCITALTDLKSLVSRELTNVEKCDQVLTETLRDLVSNSYEEPINALLKHVALLDKHDLRSWLEPLKLIIDDVPSTTIGRCLYHALRSFTSSEPSTMHRAWLLVWLILLSHDHLPSPDDNVKKPGWIVPFIIPSLLVPYR